MKIVCDSCATKYSISDDKVRGKVFKIRCKKCSHIIVVRGTNDAAAAPAAAATSEGGGWHLVVEGEQVGPLPEAEIRARLGRGEINGETYIWKEGLADWLKLSTVPEFADAASPGAQPTDIAGGPGDLFTDSAPLSRGDSAQVQVDEAMVASSAPAPARSSGGGGLFSAVDAAAASPAVSPARVGRANADHDDGFGAPMAARGGGGDLFASHAAASSPSIDEGRRSPAANHDGGRVENLTAQRHENSVLFSLANLQQLAMPSPAPKASAPITNGNGSSEGSGLIDIRAMAATTLGAPRVSSGGGNNVLSDDLPTFGSFSAAAPVLLPIPTQSGPPKWIYAVIGGMLLLVIGIGVMAYKILTTKPVTVVEQVAAPAPVAAPVAAAVAPKAPAAAPTPATAPTPDENLPPREGAPGTEGVKAAGGDAAKREKGGGKGAHAAKGGGKPAKGGATAEGGGTKSAAPAAAPAEPEKKGPAKGSLDDLLENALSGKKARRPAAAASDDDAPAPRKAAAAPPAEAAGPLSSRAIVAGMNAAKPKVNECYNQFKVPGVAMVNVVIGKSGKVTSATVSGKFAGTPTGGCVEKAVKTASFPPSDGLTTPYPFQLR